MAIRFINSSLICKHKIEPTKQRQWIKRTFSVPKGTVRKRQRTLEELSSDGKNLVDSCGRKVNAQKIGEPTEIRFREVYIVTNGFGAYAFENVSDNIENIEDAAYERVTKEEKAEGTWDTFTIKVQYWNVIDRESKIINWDLGVGEVDFSENPFGYE